MQRPDATDERRVGRFVAAAAESSRAQSPSRGSSLRRFGGSCRATTSPSASSTGCGNACSAASKTRSELTVGLDAPLWHTKVFLFSRGAGCDFSERDCVVLDLLRPSLEGRYELWLARSRRPQAAPEL